LTSGGWKSAHVMASAVPAVASISNRFLSSVMPFPDRSAARQR
jgi:hypothetical protein